MDAAPTDSNAVKLRNVHSGVTNSIINNNVILCASVGPTALLLLLSSLLTLGDNDSDDSDDDDDGGKMVSANGKSMSRNNTPYPTMVKKQMVDTNPMEKYLA